MFEAVNNFLQHVDDLVWGVPLIVAILLTGIYLTIRLKGIQITKLPKALKYMFENEESGHGEVTSFGALCTALSATIGTGNIVGCGNRDRSRRSGSVILDGNCSPVWYGNEIFRRSSRYQIPYNGQTWSYTWRPVLLYRKWYG